MGRFLNAFKPISKLMPEVKPPERKVGLAEKFLWTGLILILYLVMSEIRIYGYSVSQDQGDPLAVLRIIFASQRGTLMELGIGPIVTAGLILQLLAGSGLISVDFSNAEERALFTSTNKFFALLMTAFEAASFILGGAYGTDLQTSTMILIFLQLLFAGLIVMLMDELVQKGWGLGSGISLFIAAGVGQRIFVMTFSPFRIGEQGLYYGAIPGVFQTILGGERSIWNILHRANLPDTLGLLSTIALFLAIIYAEGIRVELPISYAKYRGFRGRYPVKLLYVSNIPVILAQALFANVFFFSQLIWSKYNPNNSNYWLNLIATYNATTNEATGGLVKYIVAPRGFDGVLHDPLQALMYGVILIAICVVFARTWIEVGGLGAKTVAGQLIDSGMQVPGFRRTEKPIQELLNRYIPVVTILGGFFVGLVAVFADFVGVFGSGTGVLLIVGILYQYYQILAQERALDMYPGLRRFMGE